MEPGRTLGRYELTRRIGAGGMGEVFEAVLRGPTGFRKRVAIKRVLGVRSGDDRRLAQEARLGALLSHPNVVATWELADTPDGWIVAMELVDGPSLAGLRSVGPLSAVAIADVGAQVAAALAYIHETPLGGRAGLVHRDIKPSNLLLDPSGLVKVADLGIAALAGRASGAAGTPGWAAPEQVAGRPEPRSDVYSLGVVLVWLVTGQEPVPLDEFPESSPSGPEFGAAPAERLFPGGVLERVEREVPGLGPIVARALHADPERRWPGARALAEELRALRGRCPPGPGLAELVEDRFRTRRAAGPDDSTFHTPDPSHAAPTAGESPLVGRVAELAELRRALAEARVVALRGPPGIGKSRLVAEVLRDGPAWRVDLEDTGSVAGMCAALGEALGVQLVGGDPVDRLGAALCERGPVLVVLDSVDAFVGHLGEVLGSWRFQAPDLRLLLVGRGRVDAAERTVALGPLGAADAAALWLAWAGTAAPDGDDGDALLWPLDGVPLAIELAAAHFRAGAPIGAPDPRMGALASAFDRVWRDLEPEERGWLGQLTVFVGGWDLDAAQRVLQLDGPPDGRWAIDVLTRLADRGLVQVDAVRGRFRLLEPVRQEVARRVDPDRRAEAEVRHAAWFVALAQLADPLRGASASPVDVRRILVDRENLTAAARRALDRGDDPTARGCCAAVTLAVLVTGPFTLAGELVDEVIARTSGPDEVQLRMVAASVARVRGDHPGAAEHLRIAAAAARATPNPAADVILALALGQWRREADDLDEAESHLVQAQVGAEALGHGRLLGRSLTDLGSVYRSQGRLAEAEGALRRAAELMRGIGEQRGMATALGNLGNVLADRGAAAEARRTRMQALALAENAGDEVLAAAQYGNLALDARRDGQLRTAASYLRSAVRIHRRSELVLAEALWQAHLGGTLVELGDFAAARAALDRGLGLAERHALRAARWITRSNLGRLERWSGRLDIALEHAVASLADAEASGERAAVGALCAAAEIARPLDPDRAWAYADRAVRWADAHADAQLRAKAQLERGLAAFARGEQAEPAADLAEALPDLGALDALEARIALAALAGGGAAFDPLAEEIDALVLLPDAPLRAVFAAVRGT